VSQDAYRNTRAVALAFVALAAALTLLPTPVAGQEAAADQAAAAPAIAPTAIPALEAMGAYLRTLKAFQVEAVSSREEVLDNGLKAESSGHTMLLARLPDRLYVDSTGDRRQRQYYYDGKEFTLYARRPNLYATAPAPATVAELASTLDEKYGIEMPLVDLFRWGTSSTATSAITEAVDLGASAVDGVSCQHYAFRQEGLDWQIWIQRGDFPLPRRMVLTTTTDEARPQYEASYTWNLAPAFSDAAFTFVPPAGAQKIVFAAAGSEPQE
jgi:hypothetical protein